MAERHASINDLAIEEGDRKFFWDTSAAARPTTGTQRPGSLNAPGDDRAGRCGARAGRRLPHLRYGGASLAAISQHTGLGKGSLYNFFPGGKEEMAEAVLEQVAIWFQDEVYRPCAPPTGLARSGSPP